MFQQIEIREYDQINLGRNKNTKFLHRILIIGGYYLVRFSENYSQIIAKR